MITINANNLSDVLDRQILPNDMADEIAEAILSGSETAVEYRRDGATHMIFFPRAKRGAVCGGGDSDWTDASSLEDVAQRWANYEEWVH